MGSNAETVDFMALLIETQNCFFVDVIRGHYSQLREPGQLEGLRDLLKRLPGQHREVGQVPAVDADAHGAVATVVQSQRHCAEVQQSTPVQKYFNSITRHGSPKL